MTRVKICGFTRSEDVTAAVAGGVDALGFNLARGPRKITLEQAAALVALVPPLVQSVLLFVDAELDEILAALAATRANVVQLHGDEPPELAAELRRRVPVIKARRVRDRDSLRGLDDYPADALLLDSYVPGQAGGTGEQWDVGLVAQAGLRKPVILAGGLSPANVEAALRKAPSYGVDCASGVESAPGIKDHRLMQALVHAVRQRTAG